MAMNELAPAVLSEEVSLSAAAEQYLEQSRPWVIFFAVMAFIAAGCMLLVGLGSAAVGLLGRISGSSERNPVALVVQGIFYGVTAVFYIPVGVLLYRYAGAIKLLRTDRSSAVLEYAMKNQRAFWRYCGIMTIVGIALCILLLVAAVLFTAVVSAGK